MADPREWLGNCYKIGEKIFAPLKFDVPITLESTWREKGNFLNFIPFPTGLEKSNIRLERFKKKMWILFKHTFSLKICVTDN